MRQIAESCGGDPDRVRARIGEIVASRGKMHNPVTASGGVLYEIHLGPYDSLADAHGAEGVVRRSHGLSPQVLLLEPPVPETGEAPEAE